MSFLNFNSGTALGAALGYSFGNNLLYLNSLIWNFQPYTQPNLAIAFQVGGSILGMNYGNQLYNEVIDSDNSMSTSLSPFNPGTFFGTTVGFVIGNSISSLCEQTLGISGTSIEIGLEVAGGVLGMYYGNELYDDLL
ncbi:MAG: hypothetical protein ACK4OM_05610 [Alphaproteobacteria bacterium]